MDFPGGHCHILHLAAVDFTAGSGISPSSDNHPALLFLFRIIAADNNLGFYPLVVSDTDYIYHFFRLNFASDQGTGLTCRLNLSSGRGIRINHVIYQDILSYPHFLCLFHKI